MNPTETQVPTAPAPGAHAPEPPKTKKHWFIRFHGRKISIAVLVVGVLAFLGASAGAYQGVVKPLIIEPQKPENVLKKGVINTLKKQQVTATGTAKYDQDGYGPYGHVKVDFKTQFDRTVPAFSSELNVNVGGPSAKLDLISLNNNAYFKVGDISDLGNVLLARYYRYDQFAPLLDYYNQQLKDQWYIAPQSVTGQAAESSGCAMGFVPTLTNDDVNMLMEAYKQNEFAMIKARSPDSVNGRAAIKFDLGFDHDKGRAFFYKLHDISFVKKWEECGLNQYRGTQYSETEGWGGNFTLWVDARTKTVSRIMYTAYRGSAAFAIDATLSYDKFSITAPQSAKSAQDLFTF